MGGEPRKTPPHCLWFLLPGWAVVPPTVARLKVGCVCVCVCVCVSFSQKRDAGLWELAAVWLVQPWPGSLLTPANRAWAFLVPPTSCWQ